MIGCSKSFSSRGRKHFPKKSNVIVVSHWSPTAILSSAKWVWSKTSLCFLCYIQAPAGGRNVLCAHTGLPASPRVAIAAVEQELAAWQENLMQQSIRIYSQCVSISRCSCATGPELETHSGLPPTSNKGNPQVLDIQSLTQEERCRKGKKISENNQKMWKQGTCSWWMQSNSSVESTFYYPSLIT